MRKPNIPQRNFERRDRLVATELLRAPFMGSLFSIPDLTEAKELVLFLGTSFIEGALFDLGPKEVAHIDNFAVRPNLQRKGLGERLLRAFTAEAKRLGAQELWSDSVSPMALGLRAKVFGAANLVFYDGDYSQHGFLPIGIEQVLQCDNRMDDAYAGRPVDENTQGYLGVYVNLEQIDTSGWELPYCTETVITEDAPYLLNSGHDPLPATV